MSSAMSGKRKTAQRGREKASKFDPWVVVRKSNGKRVFIGDGVPEAQAKITAAGMVEPSEAVPVSDVRK